MEIDKALGFAAILAWKELSKFAEPRSARVEYQADPGKPLADVSIWVTNGTGCRNLVCDYSRRVSPTHADRMRFANGYYSKDLGENLNFILNNQNNFSRRADACRDGLVMIHPPTDGELSEAAHFLRGAGATTMNLGGAVSPR